MLVRLSRVVLGLMLLLAASVSTFAADPQKPNVLFIAVDDLNDWIGCLGGHPQVKTPNIDRLAARGMLFTNAHCAAPACNPSRAALLSGLRPSSTGIYHNNQPFQPILRDMITLPEHFRNNGYRVLGGGKIYHGADDSLGEWDGYFKRQGDPHPTVASISGLNRSHFDWGPLDASDEEMGDYRLVSWASEQLQQKQDKPLFLAVGFVKPHLPWYVPKKYFDMFPLDSIQLPKTLETDLDDVPEAGRKMARPDGDHRTVVEANQWKHAVQGYLATIAFLDGQVGRLLEAFDRSPYADNTIVIFWGDHGWHLGEKQHWRKFALWEEATQAPLIYVVPGLTKPNSRCDRPVDFMSIYPTLSDLCGLPLDRELDGVSIRPLLQNPQAEWNHFAVTTHGRNNHAVRSQQYRYIRYADGSEELYDHQADEQEWKNLADDPHYASVKRELQAALPQRNVPDAPRERDDRPRGKAKGKRANRD